MYLQNLIHWYFYLSQNFELCRKHNRRLTVRSKPLLCILLLMNQLFSKIWHLKPGLWNSQPKFQFNKNDKWNPFLVGIVRSDVWLISFLAVDRQVRSLTIKCYKPDAGLFDTCKKAQALTWRPSTLGHPYFLRNSSEITRFGNLES